MESGGFEEARALRATGIAIGLPIHVGVAAAAIAAVGIRGSVAGSTGLGAEGPRSDIGRGKLELEVSDLA